MRNKYAQVFIEDILKYQNEENVIQETIRSWLCKKITFLATPSGDEKKSRIPIAPFWREFSEVKLEVKATFERHNITLEDSMMHVVRNNKSLSAMYFIKKYYEENKNLFKSRYTFKAKHILVESEEKADELKKLCENGEEFEELAKKYCHSEFVL